MTHEMSHINPEVDHYLEQLKLSVDAIESCVLSDVAMTGLALFWILKMHLYCAETTRVRFYCAALNTSAILVMVSSAVTAVLTFLYLALFSLYQFCTPLLQPTAARQAPHSYCDDLISYLRVTFMNLSNLPASMREAAHFTCMTHVCDCMLQASVE